MALFTDGPISAAADLQRYENSILDVATSEGIDLGSKLGLAQEELENQLLLFLLRQPTSQECSWGFRRTRGVKDVAVTVPMQQWHVHKTLALVYRDAYYNQLNDRYQAKWAEYETLAKASEKAYFQIGVGLVPDPVPKATAPTLSKIRGPGASGTLFVAVTWVNSLRQEGTPSDLVSLGTSQGEALVVTPGAAPEDIKSWNVYVGTSPSSVSLQNDAPLAAGSAWTMQSGPVSGEALPSGQEPMWFVPDHRVIERG